MNMFEAFKIREPSCTKGHIKEITKSSIKNINSDTWVGEAEDCEEKKTKILNYDDLKNYLAEGKRLKGFNFFFKYGKNFINSSLDEMTFTIEADRKIELMIMAKFNCETDYEEKIKLEPNTPQVIKVHFRDKYFEGKSLLSVEFSKCGRKCSEWYHTQYKITNLKLLYKDC